MCTRNSRLATPMIFLRAYVAVVGLQLATLDMAGVAGTDTTATTTTNIVAAPEARGNTSTAPSSPPHRTPWTTCIQSERTEIPIMVDGRSERVPMCVWHIPSHSVSTMQAPTRDVRNFAAVSAVAGAQAVLRLIASQFDQPLRRNTPPHPPPPPAPPRRQLTTVQNEASPTSLGVTHWRWA